MEPKWTDEKGWTEEGKWTSDVDWANDETLKEYHNDILEAMARDRKRMAKVWK